MKNQKVIFVRTEDLELHEKVLKAAKRDKLSVSSFVVKILSESLNKAPFDPINRATLDSQTEPALAP